MYYCKSTENHQNSVKVPAETKIGKLVVKLIVRYGIIRKARDGGWVGDRDVEACFNG